MSINTSWFDRKLTKKQLDVLLYLRKNPHTFNEIAIEFNFDKELLNQMVSDGITELTGNDNEKYTVGLIFLNHMGETVAQAEYDRRFDMYLTRTASLAAIIISGLTALLK